jgi:AcrR family transcriptional regulator
MPEPSNRAAGGTGTAGPGRPRDARHDKAILDAAAEILFDKGYSGLSIDGVAAAAGVSRPTIYRRWSSKLALAVAAVVHSSGLVLPVPDTGSVRRDLIAVQRHHIKNFNEPRSRRVTAGIVADLANDPELTEFYLHLYAKPRRASIWQALQRGVDRRELRPGIDFMFVTDLLLGPLFVRSVVWGQRLDPAMASKTVDVVMAAFGTVKSES